MTVYCRLRSAINVTTKYGAGIMTRKWVNATSLAIQAAMATITILPQAKCVRGCVLL